MDEALWADINFFDTSDVYGGSQTPDMEKGFGISEKIRRGNVRWRARRHSTRHVVGGRTRPLLMLWCEPTTDQAQKMSSFRDYPR